MPQFSDAWLAHQRKRWTRPDAHRWVRHDHARFLPPHERKAGFNPDQPRDEIGRWTDTGAEEQSDHETSIEDTSRLDELSAARRRDRADGHHYVPRKIFRDKELSEEARQVFKEAKTGRLYNPRLNLFDGDHRTYNDVVADLFKDFVNRGNIEKSKNDSRPGSVISERSS